MFKHSIQQKPEQSELERGKKRSVCNVKLVRQERSLMKVMRGLNSNGSNCLNFIFSAE